MASRPISSLTRRLHVLPSNRKTCHRVVLTSVINPVYFLVSGNLHWLCRGSVLFWLNSQLIRCFYVCALSWIISSAACAHHHGRPPNLMCACVCVVLCWYFDSVVQYWALIEIADVVFLAVHIGMSLETLQPRVWPRNESSLCCVALTNTLLSQLLITFASQNDFQPNEMISLAALDARAASCWVGTRKIPLPRANAYVMASKPTQNIKLQAPQVANE